jgi:hypothetical protein
MLGPPIEAHALGFVIEHLAGRMPRSIGRCVVHRLGLARLRVQINRRESCIRRVSAIKRVDKSHVRYAHFLHAQRNELAPMNTGRHPIFQNTHRPNLADHRGFAREGGLSGGVNKVTDGN